MTNKIKLKKSQDYCLASPIYEYKNWIIEWNTINWTAKKSDEDGYLHFVSLKDVRNYLNSL